MAPHGEEDGGDAQQQGEQPLVALEAERQDGGDQEQRHQPVEPRRRQTEAEKDGWTGEQHDEDHEQDAEPPLAVRLPPIPFLRLLGSPPRPPAPPPPPPPPGESGPPDPPPAVPDAGRREQPQLPVTGRPPACSPQERQHPLRVRAGQPLGFVHVIPSP